MDPIRILIVEDEPDLREIYVETLKGAGYHVDTASDGEEGLKKMKAGGWSLVLLDIILPKIDGLGIMKMLQYERPSRPNKCILFITNVSTDAKIRDALKLGDGYLIKTQITPADLLNEVKNYLGKI